jgi:hypothetical protein
MKNFITDQTSASQTILPQKSRNEANLTAIVENFDGYVWSIDTNLRYIILNSALDEKR